MREKEKSLISFLHLTPLPHTRVSHRMTEYNKITAYNRITSIKDMRRRADKGKRKKNEKTNTHHSHFTFFPCFSNITKNRRRRRGKYLQRLCEQFDPHFPTNFLLFSSTRSRMMSSASIERVVRAEESGSKHARGERKYYSEKILILLFTFLPSFPPCTPCFRVGTLSYLLCTVKWTYRNV